MHAEELLPAHPPVVQVLRLKQVCGRTGLCRAMIYRLEAQGRFPERIQLGCRAIGRTRRMMVRVSRRPACF